MKLLRLVAGLRYRFGGVIAPINERMFRFHLNGIPFTYFALLAAILTHLYTLILCISYYLPSPSGDPFHLSAFDALGATLAMLLLSATIFALISTRITRFVVFQQCPLPMEQTLGALASLPLNGLRVSGRFMLGSYHATRRFRDVPVLLARAPNREPVFLASVDASEKWMGITTSEMRGVWAIVLGQFDLNQAQTGLFYGGLSAFPALRLSYKDGITGKPETVVIRFAEASEFAAGIAYLRDWETHHRTAPFADWRGSDGFVLAPSPAGSDGVFDNSPRHQTRDATNAADSTKDADRKPQP